MTMARYSPGTSPQFPSGLVFALPIWKKAVNIVDPDYQPDITDFTFGENRFDELNASGEFPNASDRIVLPDNEILQSDSFSFTFWVKIDSFSNLMEFVAKARATGDANVTTLVRSGGFVSNNIQCGVIDVDSNVHLVGSGTLMTDRWYHIAVTYSSTSLLMYLDGSPVDSTLTGETPLWGNFPFSIGNRWQVNRPLNGALASFYYWDRVITSTEVLFMSTFYEVGKGSQAGNTFQRSGNSFSIRSRKKPRFQRTARTSLSRNAFHYVQSNYRNLSSGDKTSWSNQVANFGRTNSLGIPYDLEPIQLFDSQNKVRVDFQLTIEDTAQAPVVFPNPSIDSVLLFAATPEAFVNVIPVEVPANFVYNVFLSEKLLSPPVNQESQTFYLMASFDEGTDSDIFFTDRWVEKFGITPQDVGKYQVFKLEIFHRPTGQRTINSLVTTELEP